MATFNSRGLSYLQLAKGIVYFWHKPTGTRMALGRDYGSPEFMGKYERLLIAARTKMAQNDAREAAIDEERNRATLTEAVVGFVATLLDRWQKSSAYRETAPQTRKDRERYVAWIRTRFGDLSKDGLESIHRHEIYEWREQFEDRPELARKVQQTLVSFLNWAADNSLIRFNPATKMKGVRKLNPRGRADTIWTAEDEEDFRAHASDGLGDLFLLMLYSGARPADACQMKTLMVTRPARSELWLTFTPAKTAKATGQPVPLPVHLLPPFRDLLERRLAIAKATDSPFLVVNQYGRPFSAQALYRHFGDVRERAGIARNLRPNDLRGTCANRLADAGAQPDSIRAILGKPPIGTLRNYLMLQKLTALAYSAWAAALAPQRGAA